MNKLTKPSATTGSALANAYIEAISKAMNAHPSCRSTKREPCSLRMDSRKFQSCSSLPSKHRRRPNDSAHRP